MSWTARRDESGWSIGKYPDHERDWQLSLCSIDGYALFLDVRIGQRHDWRIRWEGPMFHPLLTERERMEQWHRLGRFAARNYAPDRRADA